jgi:hypothetical protein
LIDRRQERHVAADDLRQYPFSDADLLFPTFVCDQSGGSTGPDSLFVVGQLSIGAATLNAERPCRTALALPGGLLCTFLPATYNVLGSLISFFSGIAVRL